MFGVQHLSPPYLVIIIMLFSLDFTRFTWFFLLKQKSELFVVFKYFKNLVKNQYSSKIKVIRSDNCGE